MTSFFNYIRGLIGNDLIFEIAVSIVIIVLSFIVAKIISYLLKEIIKPFVEKSKSQLDDKILEVAETGTFRLIILGGFYFAVNNLRYGYFLYEENDEIHSFTGLYGYDLINPTNIIDPIPLPMVIKYKIILNIQYN